MSRFLLAVSFVSLGGSPLLLWRSRRNIPAILGLSTAILAFVIPIYGATVLNQWPSELEHQFARIIMAGAVTHLIGVMIGGRVHVRPLSRIWLFRRDPSGRDMRAYGRRLRIAVVSALIVLTLCFLYMGFVPAFTAQPFLAKYFRGPYYARYAAVALPFRMAFYVAVALVPVLLAHATGRRRAHYAVLTVAALVMLLVTLNRAAAASGVLLFILVAMSRRQFSITAMLATALFLMSLGATIFLLFSPLTAQLPYETGKNLSYAEQVALGSPDLNDSLLFLQQYNIRGAPTHGRTFVGGLVPYHYRWNPALWTLSVIDPTATGTNANSGGLRLPLPVWGYVSFGYPGVVGLSLLVGCISGAGVRFLRTCLQSVSRHTEVLAYAFFIASWGLLEQFYVLSTYSLPGVLCLWWLARRAPLEDRSTHGLGGGAATVPT